MVDFQIKQGDTNDPIKRTLKSNGSAEDVSSSEVNKIRFLMRQAGKSTLKVDDNLSGNVEYVNSGGDGQVQYNWQSGDTDTAGLFVAEFEVEWSDGSPETFPNKADDPYITIEIVNDLG